MPQLTQISRAKAAREEVWAADALGTQAYQKPQGTHVLTGYRQASKADGTGCG